MLPLIVTAASTSVGMKRFIMSARKIAKDAEFLFIEFQPSNPNEIDGRSWMVDFPNARRIIIQNIVYPGNQKRHLWIKTVMEKTGYTKQLGRWVVFVDTDDVIFQGTFPELDPGKRIYVSGEGLTHAESDFWPKRLKKNIAFRPIMDKQIYNMGAVMMRMEYYLDFLNFMEDKLKRKTFTKDFHNDQPLFNLWLAKFPRNVIGEHKSLMVSLYNNLKLGKVKKNEKGIFINSEKVPFTIVHANGSTKTNL